MVIKWNEHQSMKGRFSAAILRKNARGENKRKRAREGRVKSTSKPSVSFGPHTCFIHFTRSEHKVKRTAAPPSPRTAVLQPVKLAIHRSLCPKLVKASEDWPWSSRACGCTCVCEGSRIAIPGRWLEIPRLRFGRGARSPLDRLTWRPPAAKDYHPAWIRCELLPNPIAGESKHPRALTTLPS